MLKKKKNLKISALLKNEEKAVRKPLPMGNTAPTHTPLTSSDCPEPGTLLAAPDWRKMFSRVIKIPQISKKPHSSQSPSGYWIVQGVEVTVEG